MPFGSVENLRKSDSFKHSQALQDMSAARLARFVDVFDRVFARAKRNGAGDDEAERTAFRIAFGVANQATLSFAKPEQEVHFFATSIPEMASLQTQGLGTEFSFKVITEDLGLARAIAVGNNFNRGHMQGEALGVIRDVILPSQAPPEIQANTDPDVPFLFVGSFFEGVPAEERAIETLSSEWLPIHTAGGNIEALPFSFGITKFPANGKEQGVRRIASILKPDGDAANLYKEVAGQDGSGDSLMGDSPKLAELEARVAAVVEQHRKDEESIAALKAKVADYETLKSNLASLAGKKADEVTPEKAVAALTTEIMALKAKASEADALKAEVASIKKAAADKEANDWATGAAREGRITTEAIPKWAATYTKLGKDEAASLLPAPHLAHEADPKVLAASLKNLEKDQLAFIKGAFGVTSEVKA